MPTDSNQEAADKKRRHSLFSVSNAFFVLAIAFVLSMLFLPSFKSGVIRRIMQIGFFQPNIERQHLSTPLSEGRANAVTFINAKGISLNLSSLKGKVIFMNVWATWCGPCKAELPSINQLKKKFQNNSNVEVLLLDADGNPAVAQNFLAKQNLTLTSWAVLGPNPDFLSSNAIPFTVVLDKQGFIAYQHMGIANYNSGKFIKFIDNLAKE